MFGAIGNLFNIIFSYPIFNGLVVLYRLFGDFGLAIIVLTVLIKLLLFPLTLQQLRSSKAMQVLQPKIAEIKKKHPGDVQSQSLAMNQLYKEYGVKPLAGCLPLVIQLPVLYGLYFAVGNILRDQHLTTKTLNDHLYSFIAPFTHIPDINLRWFEFLNPHWYISLGQPDPTHILPILAGLATFVSLRMAQPRNAQANKNKDKNTPDPMVQSMQTMQYVMPFVTIFIGWTFPAGLALYWTISSIFQAVQQYFVTGWGSLLTTPKFANDPKVAPAVVESTLASEGKKQREKDLLRRSNIIEADSASDEDEEAASGPVASQMRTGNNRSGSSTTQQQRRRSRNSSASARRRGSAQRSRG
ncbi:hypothetical protein KSD_30590 [Ktedonobacter sp. SOSP1-85]|uniref:YidC/Oxa1 family membrane protein insertase n=1 Tax=Ktedonobacter sp. SOSP1-85 TaxID=2778367 RepID=UPI00191548C3|nr:YidC/Oxa1 family membrane protein insertase [Ktedonobacter sp. SOSP1-85]GHO75288.1 hypothetical protein KSD_30590 [Ktedonobacter sp. SOSP1-85]